jgi:site-specific DNA-methyltransferase (adenine-specific)
MSSTSARRPARQRPSSGRRRRWQITEADCFEALPSLTPNTVDAVVADPPYGIGVCGQEWDRPRHLDRAAVPGRRQKRPENPNQRLQQFSREWSAACMRSLKPGAYLAVFAAARTAHRATCGLEEAGYEVRDVLMWLQGQGYPSTHTSLKPAWEPIILARKPLEGTVEANLAKYGTGALNIDACRVELTVQDRPTEGRMPGQRYGANTAGRWPANLLLSHGETCTAERCDPDCPVGLLGERHRFFYSAKASRRERDAGCERLPRRVTQTFKIGAENERICDENPVANVHPTVKPIELMRWLIRLLNPEGGLVLDPFAGSGSTGAAAVLEGARFHGIEREAMYVPIARARIAHWSRCARTARRPACVRPASRKTSARD